jgi:hypothetical protein
MQSRAHVIISQDIHRSIHHGLEIDVFENVVKHGPHAGAAGKFIGGVRFQ